MVLGRRNKKVEKDMEVIKSAFQQETPDIEVDMETEQPIEEVQPVAQPVPVQPAYAPQPAPVAQAAPAAPVMRAIAPEEPLKIRVISGEVTETGFVYTIVTNKQFANIGDVINMQ